MRIRLIGLSLVLALVGIATLGAQGPIPATTIGSHHMGESYAEWLPLSHKLDDLEAVCQSKRRGQQGRDDKTRCKFLQDVRDGKQSKISTGDDDRQFIWQFGDGKLWEVEISVPSLFALASKRPDIQQEIRFLIETYGEPKERSTVPYQNGYGARWDCEKLSWSMPDGTQIVAAESISTTNFGGPKRTLLVAFFSKDYLSKSAEPRTANPYGK